MTTLAVGTKIDEIILARLKELRSFLLIDDGPLIEEFIRRTRRKYTKIDFSEDEDCFNPISGMNDLKAEEFLASIDALFEGGKTTLRRQDSNHLIYKTLVISKPRTLHHLLHKLLPPSPKDTDFKDAAQKIERIVLSRVLQRALAPDKKHSRQTFAMRGILLVRINRAELGPFASRALALFLISRYEGQICVPAFGYYGIKSHVQLIHQDRLIAGVNHLSESDLRDDLLLIKDKEAGRCLPEDAEVLASHKGLRPGINEFNTEIETSIK
jgi:hypothetical protein